eukprot:1457135-Prymnesium_polylepis.1
MVLDDLQHVRDDVLDVTREELRLQEPADLLVAAERCCDGLEVAGLHRCGDEAHIAIPIAVGVDLLRRKALAVQGELAHPIVVHLRRLRFETHADASAAL